MTYALREAREYAAAPLPAQMPRRIAPEALIALGFRGLAVHDSVHAWLATAWHARTMPPEHPERRTHVTSSCELVASTSMEVTGWPAVPAGHRRPMLDG
jgi:hypothetical protein